MRHPSKPKSGANRQAAYAARGRQVSVVLRDEIALATLDSLVLRHGGVTAAITFALHAAYARLEDGSASAHASASG